MIISFNASIIILWHKYEPAKSKPYATAPVSFPLLTTTLHKAAKMASSKKSFDVYHQHHHPPIPKDGASTSVPGTANIYPTPIPFSSTMPLFGTAF